MLARLEQDVDQALSYYDIVGNEVFGKPRLLPSLHKLAGLGRPKYATRRMEQAVQEVIKAAVPHEINGAHYDADAERLPLRSDPRRCRCIVVSLGGHKLKAQNAYLFRSYDHDHLSPGKARSGHLNPEPAHQEPIWFVARATSAAPAYFRSAKLPNGRKFLDGGMVENNPSWVAYHEVKKMHPGTPNLIVSIGTGMPPDDATKPNLRKRVEKKEFAEIFQIVSTLLTRSESRHTDMEDHLQDLKDSEKPKYHRLNVPHVGDRGENMKDILLDEWEPKTPKRSKDKLGPEVAERGSKTKDKIRKLTIDYLTDNQVNTRLIDCAWQLVKLRRRRAKTQQWEDFACRFIYSCQQDDCGKKNGGAQTFRTRDEFRKHAAREHSMVIIKGGQAERACVIGDCLLDGPTIFTGQAVLDFKSHLAEDHGIEKPVFMTRDEMDQWLDAGRRPRNGGF